MLIKIGSRGKNVQAIQKILGVTADGIFGPGTEAVVKKWQAANGLVADGLVGKNTLAKMQLDNGSQEVKQIQTNSDLVIDVYHLPKGEYKEGPSPKEYLFLHHTAGWQNPYRVIDAWGTNGNGTIATEFVMGGQSVKGNNIEHDGKVLQAFPQESYAWHLGKNGSQTMHKNSIGIEVCNFGYIEDGKTYAGTTVVEDQIVNLDTPFRGFSSWHRYSDLQLANLKKLILFIADRDQIDVRKGLVEEIKKKGAAAFEYNEEAFYGKVKGMWTHTNTRKDKTDMFPQQELLDMLLDL